ncbi:MAG: TldD/PmbA family protein [Oscillospiraceae bacterium]|nr:TldD/PmbA family protein [Oscillospiraceae bacterium]
MLNHLIELLKNSGVYGWELTDVKTHGWEFYFIRHALDQNRAKDVEHIQIKVYQCSEDGQSMGSASAELAPTASEAEAKALIESLAYRATLVKNKPYTLNPPRTAPAGTPAPAADVAAISRDFLNTMRAVPETAGEDINSYEIFVSERTRRFVTSTGIDITESYPESMIEVVVNARRDGHEIELYRSYNSGTCDAEGLARDLAKTMQYGKDRLRTSPTPNLGKCDVLFSTNAAVDIYRWFVSKLSAQMIVRQMSDWEIGKPIVDSFSGDRITVDALRTLPNSDRNRSYDAEGAPIRDLTLMKEGVPAHFVGDRMFSCYLGLEDSFMPFNLAVSGGTRSEAELREGTYLEAVEFSDFQVDSMTGDIFGEIRLGYLHEGEKCTVVSGGSVSGSMRDFVRNLRASEETTQYNNWRVPALTRLAGVTVTGISE